MRFSERLGITQPILTLQRESMSTELRTSLWNLFIDLHVAKYFRKFPVDDLSYHSRQLREWLKEYFFGLAWYDAYNFVEFIANNHDVAIERLSSRGEVFSRHPESRTKIETALNIVLEQDRSGYRFIAHVLSPNGSGSYSRALGYRKRPLHH